MNCGVLLHVVIGEGPLLVQLLTLENESLLLDRDRLLVLQLLLEVLHGVGGQHIKS